MFKWLRGGNGRRNARPTAVSGAGRISGLGGLRTASAPGPRRPAFMPDTPQEQAIDAKSRRLGGLEK